MKLKFFCKGCFDLKKYEAVCNMYLAIIFPTSFFSEVDAFVSNQSKIYITEPDLWSDPSEVITYDLSKTNTEIEATCTGYGGNPEPIFHW